MTWLLVGAGLVLFGGGMVTGLSLHRDQSARVVERQTELIGELQISKLDDVLKIYDSEEQAMAELAS